MKKILILIGFILPVLLFGQSRKYHYGLITLDGKEIISPKYQSVDVLSDKYVLLKENLRYGLADSLFNLLTPAKYQSIRVVSDQYILLEEENKYAVADTSFNMLTLFFDDMGILEKKFPPELFISAVRQPERWESLKNNLLKIDAKYSCEDSTYSFSRLAPNWIRLRHYNPNQREGRFGIIDILGNEVIPPIYDELWKENNWLLRITKDYKIGFLDMSLKEIIPCIYDDVEQRDDYFYLYKGNRMRGSTMGIINSKGDFIVPMTPPNIEVVVRFLNRNKLLISTTDYSPENTPIVRGGNNVTKGVQYGIIDTTGKIVQPVEYGYIGNWGNDYGIAIKNNKYAFITKEGEFLTPFIYEKGTYSYDEGGGRGKRDSLYYYIDSSGKEVFPLSRPLSVESDSLNGTYIRTLGKICGS